jgi:hypothetical protein
MDWCKVLPGLVLFRLVVPPLQSGVVGPYPVRGIWFPRNFLLEGTESYPDLLSHNQRPAVPGVQDLKPSVERVVGAVHSTGGRIGIHMSLWVPPQDSVVRPWGRSLHGRDSESCSGIHRVASEATAKLKVQVEAKFHMYYFGFS